MVLIMDFDRKIIFDDITEYINGYYKAQNKQMDAFRKMAEADGIPIILEETESFLNLLLNIKKPKCILELGTAVGYSSCFFANVCDAQIYTVEREIDAYNKALKNINAMGFCDRIHVLNSDGVEAINKLKKEALKFDFVFIDAAKSHYKKFLEAALDIVTDDVVIVSDNVLFRGLVKYEPFEAPKRFRANVRNLREFNDFALNNHRFISSILTVGDGLTVTTLKKEEHE